MTWDTLDEQQQALLTAATHLPSAPYSPGMTETAILQKQLHAVLAPIQTAQIMAGIASQRQLAPQVIEPALLTALVQAVHYGGVTINGPDLDHEGQRHFYLEQQNGHACAQHAVNAMVGGPLVSLEHFARWESNAEAQHDVISASEEDIADTMLKQGVHPETVHGALQGLIPTHFYAHRPIVNAQGLLVLDPAQARFLDGLNTDRLLLQADRYEGDSATSHYVAFRRDAGQWVLLDSLHDAPQYGVAPSDYLLRDEGIRHFTAIWPQHALRGDSAFVEIEDMVPELPWILDEATHEDGGLQDFQVFHTDLRQQVRVDQAIAAGAVVTDEQLAQLNKTVLDDLMQKAERYSDNTALTKDYYRDVLEEVAHFLMQLPQKSSLMDLQNLLNSSYHMHVWKLINKFSGSEARVTLGNNKNLLLKVINSLKQSASSDAPIKLHPSEISRQAERLIHDYVNTQKIQAQVKPHTLSSYARGLMHFAKWLDAKRYGGQPVSEEKKSLERLGSLEKLRTYPFEKSVNKVIARFLQERQNDPKVTEKVRQQEINVSAAVKSFRKSMKNQERGRQGPRDPASTAASVITPSRQSQLLRQLDEQEDASTSSQPQGMQAKTDCLANNPLVQYLLEDSDDEQSFLPDDSLLHPFLQDLADISAESRRPVEADQVNSGFPAPASPPMPAPTVEPAAGSSALPGAAGRVPRMEEESISSTEAFIQRYRNATQKKGMSSGTIDSNVSCVSHLAKWLEMLRGPDQKIPYGLDNLEKLGRHPNKSHVRNVLKLFRTNYPDHPSISSHINSAFASFQQTLWPDIHPPKIHSPKIQIQISSETEQIICIYMVIAQREGSHEKKSKEMAKKDAWCLRHLANWLEQGKGILYGFKSLSELGERKATKREPTDEEIAALLASFKQSPQVPLWVRMKIQNPVNTFRWIWHWIDDTLKKEKQAAADREADQFAADLEEDLEAESPLSPDSLQNVAMTDSILAEESLVQSHQPMSEASGRQLDAILDHTPQSRETGIAVLEEQGASSTPEWNIPFDPPAMEVLFQNFENEQPGNDFFDFALDENEEGSQAAGPEGEQSLQSDGAITSQANLASASQTESGAVHARANANPASASSTVPVPLAPRRSRLAALQQRLLTQVTEVSRMAQPDVQNQPAPEMQAASRVVRPRTAAPSPFAPRQPERGAFQKDLLGPVGEAARLAPRRSPLTALQQRLLGQLGQASRLAQSSFPSHPRSRRGR